MTLRILYFVAAALFVTAGLISTVNDGVSLKTGFGLLMGAIMVWSGIRTKVQSATR